MTAITGAATAATAEAVKFLQTRHRFHWAEVLPWVIAIAVFYLLPGYRLLATQILVMILLTLIFLQKNRKNRDHKIEYL